MHEVMCVCMQNICIIMYAIHICHVHLSHSLNLVHHIVIYATVVRDIPHSSCYRSYAHKLLAVCSLLIKPFLLHLSYTIPTHYTLCITAKDNTTWTGIPMAGIYNIRTLYQGSSVQGLLNLTTNALLD